MFNFLLDNSCILFKWLLTYLFTIILQIIDVKLFCEMIWTLWVKNKKERINEISDFYLLKFKNHCILIFFLIKFTLLDTKNYNNYKRYCIILVFDYKYLVSCIVLIYSSHLKIWASRAKSDKFFYWEFSEMFVALLMTCTKSWTHQSSQGPRQDSESASNAMLFG